MRFSGGIYFGLVLKNFGLLIEFVIFYKLYYKLELKIAPDYWVGLFRISSFSFSSMFILSFPYYIIDNT